MKVFNVFQYVWIQITRLATGANAAYYRVQDNERDVAMGKVSVWLVISHFLSLSHMHFQ